MILGAVERKWKSYTYSFDFYKNSTWNATIVRLQLYELYKRKLIIKTGIFLQLYAAMIIIDIEMQQNQRIRNSPFVRWLWFKAIAFWQIITTAHEKKQNCKNKESFKWK